MKASKQKITRGRKRKIDFSTAAGWKYCPTGSTPLGGGAPESLLWWWGV